MGEEKTRLDQTKKWFANQRLFVVIAIILIALVGLAQAFKAVRDIKESGEDIFLADETSVDVQPAKAEKVQILGKVVDTENRPVKNAKVELLGLVGVLEYTDDSGAFILSGIETEKTVLELIVERDNYLTYNKKFLLKDNTQIDIGKVILTRSKSEVKVKNTPSKSADKKIEISGGDFSGNTYIGNKNVTINNGIPHDTID